MTTPATYTLRRYIESGSIGTYDDSALPVEWLPMILASLGFSDLDSFHRKLSSLRTRSLPKTLHKKVAGIFTVYYTQETFLEPLWASDASGKRHDIPHPFALHASAEPTFDVGWLFLTQEAGILSIDVRHVEIAAKKVMQPISPSARPVCDWLAVEGGPEVGNAPRSALRRWLEENGLKGKLAEDDGFIQEFISCIQNRVEDALSFDVASQLSEMVEGGTSFEASDQASWISPDNVKEATAV